jgi:hypothetical protein
MPTLLTSNGPRLSNCTKDELGLVIGGGADAVVLLGVVLVPFASVFKMF